MRWLKVLGVIAGVLMLAGAAFVAVIWWQFTPHVQPEYLAELRADPMASHEQDGLTLVSTVADEAADTWKGFFAAELVLGYSLAATTDPADAIEIAAQAAERHEWERVRTYGDVPARFVKERSSLVIRTFGDGPAKRLTITLRNP